MKFYSLNSAFKLVTLPAWQVTACLILTGASHFLVSEYKVQTLNLEIIGCGLWGLVFRFYLESLDRALRPIRLPRHRLVMVVATIVATGLLSASVYLVTQSSNALEAHAITLSLAAAIAFFISASSFFWLGKKFLVSLCILSVAAFIVAVSRIGKPDSGLMLMLLLLCVLLFWVSCRIFITVFCACYRWAVRLAVWKKLHECATRVLGRDATQVYFELYCVISPLQTRNVLAAMPLGRQERCNRILLLRRCLAVLVYIGLVALSIRLQVPRGHLSYSNAFTSAGAGLILLSVLLMSGFSHLSSVIDPDQSVWRTGGQLFWRYLGIVILGLMDVIASRLHLYQWAGFLSLTLCCLIVETIEKQVLIYFLQRSTHQKVTWASHAVSLVTSMFAAGGIFILLLILFLSGLHSEFQPALILAVAMLILWRQERLLNLVYLHGQLSSNVKESERGAMIAAFWLGIFGRLRRAAV